MHVRSGQLQGDRNPWYWVAQQPCGRLDQDGDIHTAWTLEIYAGMKLHSTASTLESMSHASAGN